MPCGLAGAVRSWASDALGLGSASASGSASAETTDILDWICSVGFSSCSSPLFQAGSNNSNRNSRGGGGRFSGRSPLNSPRGTRNQSRSYNYENIHGGSLRANDLLSSQAHGIEKHVGRNEAYLRGRINEGKRAASTFYTERLANEAVNAALGSQQGRDVIRFILAGGGADRVKYDVGHPVGMVLRQGQAHPVPAQQLTVVLVPSNNPQSPGFVVMTYFLD